VANWYGLAMVGGPARDQAYQQLAALLDRGVYPPGSRLPGERSLADQLKVSRSTLRLALTQLADDGRVVASAQRGWFVPQLVLGEPPSQLVSFTELAAQRGLRASSTVLGRTTRPATFEEAGDLQIAAAAPVVEIIRLRGMDGVPITVEKAVLPLRRVEWLATEDLSDRSLYTVLEQHDIRLHRSTYTVQAMNAGDWEAGLLDLPVGAAVLVARDVTYTVDRVPMVITVNRYRGDAYRFTADLFRSAV
jgi:GntR family transcriptional regulator